MAAKIGDRVRFLNDVGGGTIVKINGNLAYVSDEDGFETPVLLRECVVVGSGDLSVSTSAKNKADAPSTSHHSSKETNSAGGEQPATNTLDISETEYGDSLNVVLGFEARDIKRLSATTFDAWLVNDSNYYLYFTLSSRSDDMADWNIAESGIIEPNIQIPVAEFDSSNLQQFEHIALQIIAFKRNSKYTLKAPVNYQTRVDTTKFAKLHCFKSNPYFDNPVIGFEIVKNDMPCNGASIVEPLLTIESVNKNKAETGQPRRVSKKAQKHDAPSVIDLHAEQLLDNFKGLSNADILNYQIDTFRRYMDDNLHIYGKKLIFIHGKGDGVLRKALLKELNYRYPQCHVQDASFKEYGYGATQVTINKRSRTI